MRDPHVERLHFSVTHSEGFIYDNPPALHFQNQLGTFHLEAGHLTVEPSEHFGSEGEAQKAIKPFLDSWMMEADMTHDVGAIRFEFEKADLIDRNPLAPGETYAGGVEGHFLMEVSCSMSLQVLRKEYPRPSNGLAFDKEIYIAYQRYVRFTKGEETIYAAGGFVLSTAEALFGQGLTSKGRGGEKRQATASALNMDVDILKLIGKLTATRGSDDTKRKAGGDGIELSANERNWLEQAIKELILRMLKVYSGLPLTRLTMAAPPPLPTPKP